MQGKKNPKQSHGGRRGSSLMVRLDDESKSYLTQAAELRQVSVSDYVRAVTVAQARREVQSAERHMITMTAEEQLAFWTALSVTAEPTVAQRKLGAVMRGET